MEQVGMINEVLQFEKTMTNLESILTCPFKTDRVFFLLENEMKIAEVALRIEEMEY